jgi:hypothetical protein
VIIKFGHVNGLVRFQVVEDMGRAARGPVDFKSGNALGFAQSDVLFERVGARATTRTDVAVAPNPRSRLG